MAGMSPTELLICVCVIGGMLLLVTVLIDRTVAIRGVRDLERTNHVQRILTAILRYQIDYGGTLPAKVEGSPERAQMIAMPDQVCTNFCPNQLVYEECLDLRALVPDYMETIPQDPFFTELGPSGYYIYKSNSSGTLTVGACITEIAGQITSTR